MKRACAWGDGQKAYDLRAQAIVIDVGQCNCSSNLQARLAKKKHFLASICHAITDPPVTEIRLWASVGV